MSSRHQLIQAAIDELDTISKPTKLRVLELLLTFYFESLWSSRLVVSPLTSSGNRFQTNVNCGRLWMEWE